MIRDLLVAFGVDHASVIGQRGYSIKEQGNPPPGLPAGSGVRDHRAERPYAEA